MKLIILVALLAFEASGADYRQFLNAIKVVESNGNSKAVGDGGRAKGIFQIHEGYFNDAKDYDTKNGGKFKLAKAKYSDCFNPSIAEQVVRAYLQCYSASDVKAGRWEVVARKHNGGPNGHQKKATVAYWNKVKKHL